MLIIVEGKTDKEFLEIYLRFLQINQKSFKIIKSDGNTNLKLIPEVKKADKIKIIFDADSNFQTSIDNIKQQLSQNDLKKCEIFLLPNNKDNGDLETLIEKIAIEKDVIDCFDRHQECLKKLQERNPDIHLPAKKTKVYAYKHAFGYKNGIDDSKFDYIFEKILDLKNEYIQPLKDFLLKF